MVDNELLPKLSQNFLEILDDDEYYDITIEVGDDPYVKVFRAHMVILNYRSPYLRRILSTNKKNNDGSLSHIKLPSISPEIFQIILRYVYGGRLSLNEYDASDIIKILISADELSLHELIPHLQSFLIQNESNWMEQNFNLIYKMSFENNSFVKLQEYCTNLISKNPDTIFKSPNFSSIPKNLLVTLIQSDNLQMSEVEVWENVIKWGLSQNPELPSEYASLSKDDFNVLKNTLQQCIPFIKFHNLTSKEFSEKVIPYKRILPKELYKDLLNGFLSLHPDSRLRDNQPRPSITSSKSVDSKIITYEHAGLISKWIDRLENADEIENFYEFELILRGSRDGFTPEKFHKICDNQSRTVSIIKVKNRNEILGGYNPIKWTANSWAHYGTTKDSFIFSFMNKKNIEDYILSRVEDERFATFNDSGYGPAFGGRDLTILGNKVNKNFYDGGRSYCIKTSYEKPIRKTEGEFSVEEYEVFKLKR